ncbi:hypothetical protein GYMLUDRAFT_183815, partial [Collybiopsis luxurians FD-317 M1]
MRLFGSALASLGGLPRLVQTRTLEAIPNQIATIENHFDFDIEPVIHAVCPRCNYLYEPQLSPVSKDIKYPPVCSNQSPPSAPPCNTPLLHQNGRPVKMYEHYPFPQWFAQFISQPGIQQHAKAFCDQVKNNPIAPADKVHTWDGDIYRELYGPDGKLFVDGGEEFHFFFLLHADFFNPEGTTGRGKHHSTGVASMRCLNLPYHIREDPLNVYISGMWRGPKEPSAVDAQLSHILKITALEMEQAYTRG